METRKAPYIKNEDAQFNLVINKNRTQLSASSATDTNKTHSDTLPSHLLIQR